MSFCLRYVNDDGDICEDFLKFIHCKSGLTGKDLYNEVIEELSSFCLDLQIVVVKVMMVLLLLLAILWTFILNLQGE